MSTINIVILSASLTFILGAIIGPFLIPVLTKLKFGQEIREIGPSWHKKKSGTPTMGGLIFIFAITISVLTFARSKETMLVLVTSLLFGLVGFIDDFIKVVMKRNLGLNEKQKLALQLIATFIFVCVGFYTKTLDFDIIVPFKDNTVNISYFYIPIAIFVMVGGTNSVNLTDGLDGLAASVTAVVGVFFTVVSYKMSSVSDVGHESIAIFSAALTGGCIAFLLFNSYPAKIFMGDTGSLFLGGAVCSMALVLKLPIILVLAGGVYVLETLSVIIQVISYKTTGKRVFKMSPIHHHFEMCGWSEKKIFLSAIFLSTVLCIISYIIIF